MLATLENLRDKMREETENFLAEEMDSTSDPRAEYETLLRELRGEADVVPPTRTPPVRHRSAA